jgi:hypothetical protein
VVSLESRLLGAGQSSARYDRRRCVEHWDDLPALFPMKSKSAVLESTGLPVKRYALIILILNLFAI